ncbi:hypothetical protein [Aliarcobacter butzleri]|uniref:hypothetical protein n=1 Tax=Aliarcobacter butzleri TaxID=28197 RepID=UPI002B24C5A9|nr:hypothetical protein [Aliarcobacter butzleri]
MKEIIENQISKESFEKISKLEKEKNQEKQKVIAQDVINELDIEDFTLYMGYDDEGDIFIALNYYYSSYGVEEAMLRGKHDVVISSEGVYIENESFLKTLKKEFEEKNQEEREILGEEREILGEEREILGEEREILGEERGKENKKEWEELRKNQKKEIQNQKKYDEISEKLEFLNNQLMNLVNFERPKCVGNYSKITEIDEEISSFEKKIEELENQLEELEK